MAQHIVTVTIIAALAFGAQAWNPPQEDRFINTVGAQLSPDVANSTCGAIFRSAMANTSDCEHDAKNAVHTGRSAKYWEEAVCIRCQDLLKTQIGTCTSVAEINNQ